MNHINEKIIEEGIELLGQGNLNGAIKNFNKVLESNSKNIAALINRGVAQHKLNNPEMAIKDLKKALSFSPNNEFALNNLANAYLTSHDYESAKKYIKMAIKLNKKNYQSFFILGLIYRAIGSQGQAKSNYEAALALNPKDINIHYNLSKVKQYRSSDKQIIYIENELLPKTKSPDYKILIFYILAKAYEDQQDYVKSYNFLSKANQLKKQQLSYNVLNDINNFKAVKSLFDNEEVFYLNDEIASDKSIIFIVGMPRSGTSLIEQILSTHSQVHGAGELEFVSEGLLSIQKQTNTVIRGKQKVNEYDILNFRNYYLNHINNFNVDEPFITDKLPLNFVWIGFLIAAFPNCKIIHIERDPIATCWSNLKTNFSVSGNAFSYDEKDVANYYILYKDMMKYWNNKFASRLFNVNYESLIDNPEKEIRKLLEYCNLNWEKNCLKFYQNKRAVRTASTSQVKNPIYKGSNQAWLAYRQFIPSLLSILDEGLNDTGKYIKKINNLVKVKIKPTIPTDL